MRARAVPLTETSPSLSSCTHTDGHILLYRPGDCERDARPLEGPTQIGFHVFPENPAPACCREHTSYTVIPLNVILLPLFAVRAQMYYINRFIINVQIIRLVALITFDDMTNVWPQRCSARACELRVWVRLQGHRRWWRRIGRAHGHLHTVVL